MSDLDLPTALRMAADELARCITCGKPHEMRQTQTGQTWADSGDGHAYRPEVPVDIVKRLRRRADGLETA